MHTLRYITEITPVEDNNEISESKVPEIDKNEMSRLSFSLRIYDISSY
jgi:hypothetical protein